MSTEPEPTPGLSILEKVARTLGVVGMFPVAFMYLAAGLVAPTWAVGVLLVIWVLLFVAQMRNWGKRPWVVLAIPFAAALIWVAVLQAGYTFLDWSP